MADSSYTFREVRYIIHDRSIEVYVRVEAHGDSPIGVQGWHYKHFVDGVDTDKDRIPARGSAEQWSIDSMSLANAILWPQKAP